MPKIFEKDTQAQSHLMVWKIEEDEKTLHQYLLLNYHEELEFKKTSHPQKKLEYLSGKICIASIVNKLGLPYDGIKKDEFGKPHLINLPFHISVSHSFPFACAILSKVKPVGIDIEVPREKLRVISEKYLNKAELEDSNGNLEKLCIQWSAKESIYKEYGKKKLIFKENIKVMLGKDPYLNGLKAKTLISGSEKNYSLTVVKLEDHILCYTL